MVAGTGFSNSRSLCFFLRFQDLLSWIHVVSHSSLGSKKIKYYTKDCLHTKNLTINTTLSYNIQYLLSCKICMNGELFWLLVLQVFNFWSWTQLLFITFFYVEKFRFLLYFICLWSKMAIFGWDVSSFRNKVTRWRWCRWSSEGTAAPSSAFS